jgi:periplasmic protein TonB
MKMVSFFLLSMALHAAALAYPVLFLEPRAASPVIVTLIDADVGGGSEEVGEAAKPETKPKAAARKTPPAVRQQQPIPEPTRVVEAPQSVSRAEIFTDVSGTIAISTVQNDLSSVAANPSRSVGVSAGGGTGETSGSGTGGAGGSGAGSGEGHGTGNRGSPSVKASYDTCPPPEYPDIARAKLAGTVILRVVVDEEGRPKSLEVNQSSGFPVLDRAAVDHVQQRCRFHPARQGDKRVESLVEFPVVFKLAGSRR